MNSDQILRQQLINLLVVEQAHMSFESAVADFPPEHINTRPPKVDYSFWQLLEHLRICQLDILDYIRDPNYKDLEWPAGYWADPNATADWAAWQNTIAQFIADRDALIAIIQNPATDFFAQIPHGREGHNILREIIMVGDHNTYHIGELGILRQIMGLWPANRKD